MDDEHVVDPEADAVAFGRVRAVDVLVLLVDVDAARVVAEVVQPPGLRRRVDELADVGLEQPARIARRLARRSAGRIRRPARGAS